MICEPLRAFGAIKSAKREGVISSIFLFANQVLNTKEKSRDLANAFPRFSLGWRENE